MPDVNITSFRVCPILDTYHGFAALTLFIAKLYYILYINAHVYITTVLRNSVRGIFMVFCVTTCRFLYSALGTAIAVSEISAADYMLMLVGFGCARVNLHGGHLPRLEVSPNAAVEAAQGSFYTPIAGSGQTGFTVRLDFYGMKLAMPSPASHSPEPRLASILSTPNPCNILPYPMGR